MKILKLWSFFIWLLPGSVAYAQQGGARQDDVVIARVNSGVIMRSAFNAAWRETLDEFRREGLAGAELDLKLNEWKPRILDELINRQFLAQQARALSINVQPEVDRLLLRMMEENNCESMECLERKMREAGFDSEEVRRIMTENLAIEALIEKQVYSRIRQVVGPEEIRQLYEENKAAFTEPAEARLSVVFIAFGIDSNQALRLAREISIQTRSGHADFTALAGRYSPEPAGKDRGKTGPVIKIGNLRPEVRGAIEQAPIGTITDPIKLENGYYIFRVDERRETAVLPLEDERVQEAINSLLIVQYGKKRLAEYLVALRIEAFIEIDSRYQPEHSEMKPEQIRSAPEVEEKEKKKGEKIKRRKSLRAESWSRMRPEAPNSHSIMRYSRSSMLPA